MTSHYFKSDLERKRFIEREKRAERMKKDAYRRARVSSGFAPYYIGDAPTPPEPSAWEKMFSSEPDVIVTPLKPPVTLPPGFTPKYGPPGLGDATQTKGTRTPSSKPPTIYEQYLSNVENLEKDYRKIVEPNSPGSYAEQNAKKAATQAAELAAALKEQAKRRTKNKVVAFALGTALAGGLYWAARREAKKRS